MPALPLPCSVTDDPANMLAPGPALTVTACSTVTLNVLTLVQLPVLAVTVYVVVVVGDKTGLAMAGLLTPAVGDQLNVVALLTVPALNAAPLQMVVSACTASVIFDPTVTVNVFETEQLPVVPVTV